MIGLSLLKINLFDKVNAAVETVKINISKSALKTSFHKSF